MNQLSADFPTPVDETRPPFRDLRFLIIDGNPDGRFLISKTLLRKFPNAAVMECQTAEAAFGLLHSEKLSLIVSHRTFEFDGVALVHELRTLNSRVLILMMSGIDRREAALAAGANAFLTTDEWLMSENYVAALLANPGRTIDRNRLPLANVSMQLRV